MKRRSDGQCLWEGQNAVINSGAQVAMAMLTRFIASRDFELLIEFHGAFRAISQVDSNLLNLISMLVLEDRLAVSERGTIARIIAEPVLFRREEYYSAVSEILGSALTKKKIHREVQSHASHFFGWLGKRKKSKVWYEDRRLDIKTSLLEELLRRPEIRGLGFASENAGMLVEAILDTVDFGFEFTRSMLSEHDFFLREYLRDCVVPPGKEVYVTSEGIDFFSQPIGGTAALVCLWYGLPKFDEHLELFDVHLAY